MRLRRWTLRTRLLVAVLAITVAGLIGFGVLGIAMLARSEMSRIDGQLNVVARDLSVTDRPPVPPPSSGDDEAGLPSTFRILFFDNAGKQLGRLGIGTAPVRLPPMDRASVTARGDELVTVGETGSDSRWRVRTFTQPANDFQPEGGTAAVIMPLDGYYATIRELRTIELAAGAGLLVLMVAVAAWLVRVGLRPLSRIEHTADAIAAGELDRRVEQTDTHTEVGKLGTAFNVMLERLSTTMGRLAESESRLRLFVADASHELRTPLTSIRGYAELYRHGGAADPDAVAMMMRRIENEATRMGVLVEDLLLLARLDEQRPLDLTEFDIAAVAGEVVRDALARHPERSVRVHIPQGPVYVVGDENRMRQVLTNLVGNGLVHTPATARIDVRVTRAPQPPPAEVMAETGADLPAGTDCVLIEVSDDGPGIPPDKAPHVFDRFYRADAARSRTGGSGLGLAIVAAVLTAHDARIQLLDRPGAGADFRIVFPGNGF
ncbi:sensor histidine kinase [Nocardia yamanashiensis]|uniref:sensor histidine kinase n=1 Tax=Nocardia yamanashiensis TaxID=209247 RepID=UPI000829FB85|nr:HAMP domain-containing sensor histidine kinase [Nocardia yamanashiensis]